jgi:hypothetical protein
VDGAVEGDAEEEDDLEDDLDLESKKTPTRLRENGNGKGKGKASRDEDDEEEEGPLFPVDPDGSLFQTPTKGDSNPSSSPSTVYPSSAMKDYSSELDFSSPPISEASSRGRKRDNDDEGDQDDQVGSLEMVKRRKHSKNGVDSNKKQRTRRYEVVGVVRKKIVFALRYVFRLRDLGGRALMFRPEPIVTATILPD